VERTTTSGICSLKLDIQLHPKVGWSTSE